MDIPTQNLRVCVLDYGSGNVRSVYNLLKTVVADVQVSSEEVIIRSATHIVLPGVGAFGATMEKIRKNLPIEILKNEVVHQGKPFLGICVGMQVLADKGYEFGEHDGLGWIPGCVEKLKCPGLPLPHMGWNDIQISCRSPLLEHFEDRQDFYFVHSYAFKPANAGDVVAKTSYGEEFCCIVNRKNIYGVQFHPEKSQKAGRVLIENFLRLP